MFCYAGDQSSCLREVKINVFKQQQLFCKCFLVGFILIYILVYQGAQDLSKSCDTSLLDVFFRLKLRVNFYIAVFGKHDLLQV